MMYTSDKFESGKDYIFIKKKYLFYNKKIIFCLVFKLYQ